MDNVLLIYNPVAGNKSFASQIDYFLEVFQSNGFNVHIFRTSDEKDFYKAIEDRDMSQYSAVIIAGGDGSVNSVISCLMKNNIEIPLGVIPAGTMNDICYNIGMPLNIKESIDQLALFNTGEVDVGIVNNDFFINSCGGGLFMEISQNTDRQLKNVMGRVAYYIEGIKKLPDFKKLSIKIVSDGISLKEKLYFFIVMNGQGAGGFHKLSSRSSMTDGLFDLIAIKACPLNELSVLLPKILLGTHLKDKNIIHLTSRSFTIENIDTNYNIITDIDGEEGPEMPLNIKISPRKINMILPPY